MYVPFPFFHLFIDPSNNAVGATIKQPIEKKLRHIATALKIYDQIYFIAESESCATVDTLNKIL